MLDAAATAPFHSCSAIFFPFGVSRFLEMIEKAKEPNGNGDVFIRTIIRVQYVLQIPVSRLSDTECTTKL